MIQKLKRCSSCKTEKPTDLYYANKGAKDGLQSVCKPCHGAASAERARVRAIRERRENERLLAGLSQMQAM